MVKQTVKNNYNFDIPEDFVEEYYDKELYKTIIENKKIYALTTFMRAIPYMKDGLIEVYRRGLWDMISNKLTYDKAVTKAAGVVGGIISKWHPHGDAAAYQSLVTLSKDFTNNYPLVHGEGNWGSVIGDPAAHYRYTECKLSEFFSDACETIRPEYVDFQSNFDGKYKEVCYLPFKIPIVLLNGTYGIADAYVASIMPHNLIDTVNLCKKYIENKSISNALLVEGYYPDCPNYGIILNKSDIEKCYKYGVPANVKMKATLEIDRQNNKIIIKDLPYGMVKNNITAILKKMNEKKHVVLSKILNIVEIKTDRDNHMHLEYEVIFDKNSNILEIARDLEKNCLMRTIPLSMIYHDNQYVHPCTIKDIVENWYKTLYTTKVRKIGYHTASYTSDKHILEGMVIIYDYLNEILEFAKKAKDSNELIHYLIKTYKISHVQADAISKMSINQLNRSSKETLLKKIVDLEEKIRILDEKMLKIDDEIISDLDFLVKKYGRPRRTLLTDDAYGITTEKTEFFAMSNGAVLWSYNQYGIFDMNNLINGKSLINGLKSIKINGKNEKGIIGSHNIDSNLLGVLVFMEEDMCKRINVSEMPGMNNWIPISDDPIIKNIVPITSENDEYIVISKDNKIKKISVKDFNSKQAVKVGNVKIIQKIDKNKDTLLVFTNKGDYHMITIDSIPLLSKVASGNMFKLDSDEFYMTQLSISEPLESIICSLNDDDSYAYILKIDKSELKYTNRASKPKNLIELDDGFKLVNVNSIIFDPKNKESKYISIGRFSTYNLSNTMLKVLDTVPKRVTNTTLGIISHDV